MGTTLEFPLEIATLQSVVESLRRGEVDQNSLNRIEELIGELKRSRDRETQEAVLHWIDEAQDAALTWIRQVSQQLDEYARQFQMRKAYETFGRNLE
jgi:non-homologous end joining protein Ku